MVVAAGPRRAIDLHPNFSSLMCCLVTFFFLLQEVSIEVVVYVLLIVCSYVME